MQTRKTFSMQTIIKMMHIAFCHLIVLAIWIKAINGFVSTAESAGGVYTNEQELTAAELFKLTVPFQSSFFENVRSNNRRSLQVSGPIALPYRGNCGQNATIYNDPTTGKSWLPDAYFSRGGIFDGCPSAIQRNISLPKHLCVTRNGNNFTYSFPVPYQGIFKVTLYFVETFFNDIGRRVFNVSAEGNKILTNFDVRASAGGSFVPVNRTFNLNISDGFLTMDFLSSVDRVTISAIEIEDGRARTPTRRPTSRPTKIPTKKPTSKPTKIPTRKPTSKPTKSPTKKPTTKPVSPTITSSSRPTMKPTKTPTRKPTTKPVSPTLTMQPTKKPTKKPTTKPLSPTMTPTKKPTSKPIATATMKPTVEPTRIPTSKPVVPVATPTAPTLLSTVRINCGTSSSYIDPFTNNTWSADMNFLNGSRYNICPADIFNTTLDAVFCSERWFPGSLGTPFNGTYTIPVVPGLYTVRLLFAELYFDSPGKRIFNIYLQNRLLRKNFDIRAITGGRNISMIIPIKTSVSSNDPNIRIILETIINNAKISGIEIVPFDGTVTYAPTDQPTRAPTRAPTFAFETILINCGYNLPYNDSLARVFAPDTFFAGGVSASRIVPIANTVDDTLYHYNRVGDSFTYEIPVPIGSFAISFLFSENEYNATGQRLFDLIVEGELLTNVDIFQLAQGALRATRLQVVRVVDDRSLSIRFSRSAQFPNAGLPTISAIEVELDQPHIAHAVASGPYFGTVVDPLTNKASVQLIGETSHTHGDGESLTNTTWKEGNTILGTTPNTNYSFGVGLHTISLEVKDSDGSTSKEVTSVTVNPFGFPAITSFVPNSGNLTGGYPVIIVGSGFNYSANQITVMFGSTELTGAAITIINQTAILVVAPSNVVAQPSGVTVQTPIGISIPSFFNYVGSVPIQWQEFKLLNTIEPTVGRFGPDSKLYIGTRKGRILKVTMNADFTSVVNTIVSFVNPDNEESILGLTLDPMDVKADPDVYFTMNRFFYPGNVSSSGRTILGRIRRASGANLETIVDIITGLPTSSYDHGLNGLEFGDDGALFFCSGSHTNGGIPGKLSESRQLKENFLSAAINIAYLNHPDFNGTIRWSAPDDGNMIARGIDVYGAGMRNPYSLVIHSNGRIYSTDNGPNLEFGRMSTSCTGETIDDQKRDDEINILEKGKYYGSPNLKRASYFNDTRQCVWQGPEQPTSVNHTAPIFTHQSSVDGIFEYHSNHFGGQLRYNLIYLRYGADLNIHRVILTSDGSAILPSLRGRGLRMNIGNASLDITQAPNGNIVEMRHKNASVYAFQPVEPPTTALIAKTCFPKRGRTSGGSTLSIYGVNMNTRSPNVTVIVGGINCPTTFISSARVDCTLPGGSGTVDIVVRNGAASSTFEKGYRYISGTLPLGFVLPVYS